MKKTIISAVALFTALTMILALAGCGNNSESENKSEITVTDIYKKVSEGVALPEETIELNADDLIDYYGIEAETVEECKAIQDACGYKDEIVIIKTKNNDSAKEAETMLKEHIEYQKEEMRNYDAEQYKVLESSKVCINGLYVAMFISAEQNEMADIFNSFFK